LVVCTALALVASASSRPAGAGPLHIHDLKGSVKKLGTWNSDGARDALLGVRLRATVCLRSAAEASSTYPSAIRISHYAVTGSPRRWRTVRTAIDRAPWLVPLEETWSGRPCGQVMLDDAIPPTHYGAESLGNPNGCYGVVLTITAGGRHATKRAIVKCGGLGDG
jgi:hypothetical protein